MENSIPNFPALTPTQIELLEKIKAEKEKLRNLSPGDPIPVFGVPELEEIHENIDRYTVRLIRSGAIKRGGDECHQFSQKGLPLARKKILDRSKIQNYYHPQLPSWAQKHLWEWIQLQRIRKEGRKNLRKTNVVGLETGMRRPRDLSLMLRTLELRGVKEEEDPKSPAMANDPTLNSLKEILEKKKMTVTDEMINNARESEVTEKKRTRVRKERGSWNSVIRRLVEERLLPKKISPQALRDRLNRLYPEVPWDEV